MTLRDDNQRYTMADQQPADRGQERELEPTTTAIAQAPSLRARQQADTPHRPTAHIVAEHRCQGSAGGNVVTVLGARMHPLATRSDAMPGRRGPASRRR